MAIEQIVERIISDAEKAAEGIISAAKLRAQEIIAEAEKRAEREKIGTEAEIAAKCKGISDGKAATARLDSQKILLKEKRRVIDETYARALENLKKLKEKEALALSARLLETYAEDGDEIVFANGFAYAAQVGKCEVVARKHLKVSPKTADIDGGFILVGKNSDKDLSYGALLALDREEHQAEIAATLFNSK